jgi:hypothetical protein
MEVVAVIEMMLGPKLKTLNTPWWFPQESSIVVKVPVRAIEENPSLNLEK